MIVEVWKEEEKADEEDEGFLTYSAFMAESREYHLKFMGKNKKLIHRIEADTWAQAMTKYHELMGWAPYIPEEDD